MDTFQLLGQVLECSVCLEQLGSTSKVLPCQHTFCQKCLLDILRSHSELKCPECRTLVTVPLDSLPSNILLMRILNEMKNASIKSNSLSNLTSSFSTSSCFADTGNSNVHSSNPRQSPSSCESTSFSNPFIDANSSEGNGVLSFTSDDSSSCDIFSNNHLAIDVDTGLNFFAPLACNSDVSKSLLSSLNSVSPNSLLACSTPSNAIPSSAVVSTSLSNLTSTTSSFMVSTRSCVQNTTSKFMAQHLITSVVAPTTLVAGSTTSSCVVSTTATSIDSKGSVNSLPSAFSLPTTAALKTTSALSDSTALLNTNSYPSSNNSPSSINSLCSNSSPSSINSLCSNSSPSSINSLCSNSSPNSINSLCSNNFPCSINSLCRNNSPYSYNSLCSNNFPSSNSSPSNAQNVPQPNLAARTESHSSRLVGSSISSSSSESTVTRRAHISTNSEQQPHSRSQVVSTDNLVGVALYDYDGKSSRDLKFKKGDTIVLKKQIDCNWYIGEHCGMRGFVPASYIKVSVSNSLQDPQCKALYDFKITSENKNCLSFSKGDLISVLRRVDENWAEGTLGNHRGIFPLSFVDPNSSAKALMASKESAKCASKVTSREVIGQDESFSGNVVSQPHEVIHVTVESKNMCMAEFSYQPRKADELELKKGQFYCVTEKCQDGWYKGRDLTTEKSGVFPGNYVTPANSGSGFSARNSLHFPKKKHFLENKANIVAIPQRLLKDENNRPPSLPPRIGPASPDKMQENKNVIKSEISSEDKTKIENGKKSIDVKTSQFDDFKLTINLKDTANKSHMTKDLHKISLQPVPLVKERYRCIAPYPANAEDELNLQLDDVIYVHKFLPDGWLKGTLQRTGKTGLFPSIFVEPH